MSDIEKIKELINPDACLHLEEDQNYYKVFLSEPQEPGIGITIRGLPQNTLVFNLDDYFPATDRIFAGTKNECCRADFIIISDDPTKRKRIVIIEIKLDKDNNSQIKKQLLGGEAFVHYCSAIMNSFWNYNFDLSPYIFHYVAFKKMILKNTRPMSPSNPSNTNANHFLSLFGRHPFQYNHLIGINLIS